MSPRWTVLVPLRALPGAKSRLAAELPPDVHRALVEAIRADTLAAVRACPAVARVVVVGDAPGPGVTLVQTSPGLNGALRDAADSSLEQWPDDGTAALVGDLPALRAAELEAVLTLAAELPRAFVADADGTGSTLVTAAAGVRLEPRYGPDSARAHRAVAAELDAAAGVRADVDTLADLRAAASIGLGPRTASAARAAGLMNRSS